MGSCWTGLSSELALPGRNNCSSELLLPGSPWSLLMSSGSSRRVGAERRQQPQKEGPQAASSHLRFLGAQRQYFL